MANVKKRYLVEGKRGKKGTEKRDIKGQKVVQGGSLLGSDPSGVRVFYPFLLTILLLCVYPKSSI